LRGVRRGPEPLRSRAGRRGRAPPAPTRAATDGSTRAADGLLAGTVLVRLEVDRAATVRWQPRGAAHDLFDAAAGSGTGGVLVGSPAVRARALTRRWRSSSAACDVEHGEGERRPQRR